MYERINWNPLLEKLILDEQYHKLSNDKKRKYRRVAVSNYVTTRFNKTGTEQSIVIEPLSSPTSVFIDIANLDQAAIITLTEDPPFAYGGGDFGGAGAGDSYGDSTDNSSSDSSSDSSSSDCGSDSSSSSD